MCRMTTPFTSLPDLDGGPRAGLIRRLFSIIDASEWDRLDEVFHEESVYERPGYQALVGFAAVREFYVDRRHVRSGEHRIEGIVTLLSRGAAWGRFVGTLKDGRPAD